MSGHDLFPSVKRTQGSISDCLKDFQETSGKMTILIFLIGLMADVVITNDS